MGMVSVLHDTRFPRLPLSVFLTRLYHELSGFADGSPDGKDPIQIARLMASRGITLFFVACEPALSGYQFATDFYQGITGITSGLMLPLTTANLLAHAIIGSVLENLDMERLIREVGQEVAARILGQSIPLYDTRVFMLLTWLLSP